MASRRQIADLIQTYAAKQTTPFSLRELFLHGQALGKRRVANTKFLHRELPIRIAQRLQDLNNMPAGLSHNPHVMQIINWYSQYLVQLSNAKTPKSTQSEEEFTALVEHILEDNTHVVLTMARGVMEMKDDLGDAFTAQLSRNIRESLNRFFMSRTGLRFILEQHIAGQPKLRQPGFSGVIAENCRPVDVIVSAAEEARRICDRCMGDAPEVIVQGDMDLTFTYVPHHLHYIMMELLKNSLRATVEHHKDRIDSGELDDWPCIDVIVARGQDDVTIKVSDRGGGIPFKHLGNVWDFMYTTAKLPPGSNALSDEFGSDNHNQMPVAPVLAGYGMGLPLCRVYAEYFGGGLDIMPMEGWGTDAYCHLSRLGDRCEALPPRVANSPGEGDSSIIDYR